MIYQCLRQNKASIWTLILFGLISGIIWRIEVEMQGWSGLKWISYFHWAVPIGVILFAVWLAIFSTIPVLKTRLWLACGFLVAAIPLYFILSISFSYFFLSGPTAFTTMANLGTVVFSLLRLSILFVYPAILVLAWVAAKRCGLRLNWRIYGLSAIVFLGAFPLAILGITIVEKNINADAIHAIKTGWIFPFMTIGLGIPFLSPPGSLK
jgi:hypothetical protein